MPFQSPLRPASPVSDSSFYYPAGVATVPNVHGMPVGVRDVCIFLIFYSQYMRSLF